MKLPVHVVISAAVSGGLYSVSGSREAAVSCFLCGVFIDLDHLVDYILVSDGKLSINDFFDWCHQVRWNKIYLFLHSYELFLAVSVYAFFSASPLWYGITLGTGFHLLADQLGNKRMERGYFMNKAFYFLIFRFRSGFLKEKLLGRAR